MKALIDSDNLLVLYPSSPKELELALYYSNSVCRDVFVEATTHKRMCRHFKDPDGTCKLHPTDICLNFDDCDEYEEAYT